MGHVNMKSQFWASNDKFFTHNALYKRNGNEIDVDTYGPHVQFHFFFSIFCYGKKNDTDGLKYGFHFDF